MRQIRPMGHRVRTKRFLYASYRTDNTSTFNTTLELYLNEDAVVTYTFDPRFNYIMQCTHSIY